MHWRGPTARAWNRFAMVMFAAGLFTILWIPIWSPLFKGYPFFVSATFLVPLLMVGVYFYKKSVKALVAMILKMGLPVSIGIGMGYALWAISSGLYDIFLSVIVGIGTLLWSIAMCIIAKKKLDRFPHDET